MDNKRFKLAVPEWCIPGDSIFSIKMAAEYGLDGVQIEAGFYETGFKLSNKRVRELYTETAKENNIELISIVLNDLNNHGYRRGRGTEFGDIAYEGLDIAIDAAIEMGINTVMVPSFLDNDVHTEEDFDNTVAALQYACDRTKDSGIIIATETAVSSDKFIRLYNTVKRDNLKLFHDTQNYMCFRGLNPMTELPVIYPYIVNQVHVKDGLGNKYSSKCLGEGDSHFAEQIEFLKNNNYAGWFVFENYYSQAPLRFETKDPMELLEKDIATLKREIDK